MKTMLNTLMTALMVMALLLSNGIQAQEHASGFIDPLSGVYTVASGDDLYAIGKRFGVTVDELKHANGLKSENIKAGQTLTIPGKTVITVTEVEITPLTSGTVTIESTSIGLGIGVSWGEGTLSYGGELFPFRMKDLSLVDLGISSVKVSGRVHNLHRVSDLAGTYKGIGGGVTVVAGGSGLKAKNEHGVILVLSSYQEGLEFSLGAAGLKIELQ